MAKVIIVDVASHYSVLNDILLELGYEVEYLDVANYNESLIRSKGMPGKDIALIITGRNAVGIFPNLTTTTVALNSLGYVVITLRANSTSNSNQLSIVLGLCSSISGNTSSNLFIDVNNYFLSEETVSNTTIINSYASYGVDRTYISSFAKHLVHRVNSTTAKHAFYLPPNTTSLTGYNLVAPIFYMDFLYNLQSTAKIPVKNLMKDILEYSIKSTKPPYLVNGSVKDVEGSSLKRELSVYSVNSKKLVNKGESDESSGEYSIGVYKEEPLFIVMNPSGLEKPDIHYNILPIPNPEYPSE